MVNSLFLKKPERIEALGRVLLLALLLWRLMERSLRDYVNTTGTPVIGWDKKATERPTTFMMVTKFSGLIVVKVEERRVCPGRSPPFKSSISRLCVSRPPVSPPPQGARKLVVVATHLARW